MTKITIKTLLLFLMIPVFGCQNQNIESYLDQLHIEGKLNGNVLVTKNGKTIFEKSFGFIDGSKNKILNKDYMFNVGSVYKEFPAVAIAITGRKPYKIK